MLHVLSGPQKIRPDESFNLTMTVNVSPNGQYTRIAMATFVNIDTRVKIAPESFAMKFLPNEVGKIKDKDPLEVL